MNDIVLCLQCRKCSGVTISPAASPHPLHCLGTFRQKEPKICFFQKNKCIDTCSSQDFEGARQDLSVGLEKVNFLGNREREGASGTYWRHFAGKGPAFEVSPLQNWYHTVMFVCRVVSDVALCLQWPKLTPYSYVCVLYYEWRRSMFTITGIDTLILLVCRITTRLVLS